MFCFKSAPRRNWLGSGGSCTGDYRRPLRKKPRRILFLGFHTPLSWLSPGLRTVRSHSLYIQTKSSSGPRAFLGTKYQEPNLTAEVHRKSARGLACSNHDGIQEHPQEPLQFPPLSPVAGSCLFPLLTHVVIYKQFI